MPPAEIRCPVTRVLTTRVGGTGCTRTTDRQLVASPRVRCARAFQLARHVSGDQRAALQVLAGPWEVALSEAIGIPLGETEVRRNPTA